MTLTQLAKQTGDYYRRLLAEQNEKDKVVASQHIQLCDAVIEAEIRREEFEWLKQFEKKVDAAARLFDSAATADAVVEACDWLDQKRADREGPQA